MQYVHYLLAIGIRGGFGFILALVTGILGFLAVWWFVPTGPYVPPMPLLVSVVGVTAAVACFFAWINPDAPRGATYITLALAMAGGMVGAWVGWWYGRMAYPEGVRNIYLVASTLRSPPVFASVTGAAIASTLTAAAYYAFRAWRYHEV